MRVLIAPGPFAGLLTAEQAAEAMAQGWSMGAAHDQVEAIGVGQGGEGLLEAAARTPGVQLVPVTVRDPHSRPVPATLAVVQRSGERTAYLDAGQAIGQHLVAAHEPAAATGTSAGVADLLTVAADLAVDRIVVAVGDGAPLDGGAGLLAGLGVDPAAALTRGASALPHVSALDAGSLTRVRKRWAQRRLILATDDDTPLLGFHGAAARAADVQALDAREAQSIDSALGHLVDLVGRATPASDLLTGGPLRLDRLPGAGAGGGVGYAALVCGARRVCATSEAATLVGLDAALEAADLIVTGTGVLDVTGLAAGAVSHVAASAAALARPVVAIVGESHVGRRETMALGISGLYAVTDRRSDAEAFAVDPVRTLESVLARLARTWSPAPR